MPRFTRTALASAIALSVTATAANGQEAAQLDNIVVSASGFEQALVDALASWLFQRRASARTHYQRG